MAKKRIITYFTDPDTGHVCIEKPTLDALDYPFNWVEWMAANGGGTIVAAEFTFDGSMTKSNESFDATTATVWLAGGKKPDKGPNELKVTCQITTNHTPPRRPTDTIFIRMVDVRSEPV